MPRRIEEEETRYEKNFGFVALKIIWKIISAQLFRYKRIKFRFFSSSTNLCHRRRYCWTVHGGDDGCRTSQTSTRVLPRTTMCLIHLDDPRPYVTANSATPAAATVADANGFWSRKSWASWLIFITHTNTVDEEEVGITCRDSFANPQDAYLAFIYILADNSRWVFFMHT